MKALRICWAALAMPFSTRAITGRVSDDAQSAGFELGEIREIAGNQRSWMAKSSTSTMPTMKPGIEAASTAMTCTIRSAAPRFTAAVTPSSVATMPIRTIATSTIVSVRGSGHRSR
jgi:hypothetical protein